MTSPITQNYHFVVLTPRSAFVLYLPAAPAAARTSPTRPVAADGIARRQRCVVVGSADNPNANVEHQPRHSRNVKTAGCASSSCSHQYLRFK